jgi:protease-4
VAIRRAVGIVLTLMAVAVVASIAGLLLIVAVVSRAPSVPDSATLVLKPAGDLPEIAPDDFVGQVLSRDTMTVRAFVDALRKAKRDPRITTVLLEPAALQLPYWAKVQELRAAVRDFRQSGKKVIAFLEYGSDRAYYLASAADQVYLMPSSPLDLTGVVSYDLFLRGTLDKIGVYPDFLGIGDYKTAPNQLTETGYTPAHREMAESLNRDMYEQLVRDLAESRRKSEAEIRALIDRGPFLPDEAVRAGLVDALAYADQLDDRVTELRGESGRSNRVQGSQYGRVSGESIGFRPRSRIAVLHAVGTIVSGRSSVDPINGAVLGSDTFVEQIRRVRDDESIDAIVLRIDSPGGSSVASDVIWRELSITRDERPSRPLVASMSDLAASGGYYIAMPSQAIVAQPGTLTGSIGIYTGKLVMDGAFEKLGIATGKVQSGANADIYSPVERFTPAHREKIDEVMRAFYDGFLDKAARSRNTTRERIEAVAGGRVWTGQQAREHGLVDALGGLDAAIELAKERAGIPADEDVELVIYAPRRSLFDALTDPLGGAFAGQLWSTLTGADLRTLSAVAAPGRLFRRGEPLALMPFGVVR